MKGNNRRMPEAPTGVAPSRIKVLLSIDAKIISFIKRDKVHQNFIVERKAQFDFHHYYSFIYFILLICKKIIHL
jgi:hypothetical protein